jgi:hypothetical protein
MTDIRPTLQRLIDDVPATYYRMAVLTSSLKRRNYNFVTCSVSMPQRFFKLRAPGTTTLAGTNFRSGENQKWVTS